MSTHDGESDANKNGFLTGQLLMAMPALQDGNFARSVVYVCAHNEEGAMGIVINQPLAAVDFDDLLDQLGMEEDDVHNAPAIHFGGPVETARGFVLHSMDFMQDDTVVINDQVAITGTVDILKAIARGEGPEKSLFVLGYAGWGPGQLEAEMQANSWLSTDANDALIFDTEIDAKWETAVKGIGIDPAKLSSLSGNA